MPVWPPGEAYSHPPKASYGVASLDRVSLRTCFKIRWCPKMYAASNAPVVDIEKSDGKCLNVIEHLLGKTAGFTHRTAYPLA